MVCFGGSGVECSWRLDAVSPVGGVPVGFGGNWNVGIGVTMGCSRTFKVGLMG